MAMIKPKLKYRIVKGINPRTKATLNRPVLVDRETQYIEQVVDFALKSGYVRGQRQDMLGALNGFIEAIQELCKSGKAVVLNDWLRIEGVLTGSVGEDGQLTDRNAYKVVIRALKELKRKASEFSWSNADGRKAETATGAADASGTSARPTPPTTASDN